MKKQVDHSHLVEIVSPREAAPFLVAPITLLLSFLSFGGLSCDRFQDDKPEGDEPAALDATTPHFWCDSEGVCHAEESACATDCSPAPEASCYRQVQRGEAAAKILCFSEFDACKQAREEVLKQTDEGTLAVDGCVTTSGQMDASGDPNIGKREEPAEDPSLTKLREWTAQTCACEDAECVKTIAKEQEDWKSKNAFQPGDTDEHKALAKKTVDCAKAALTAKGSWSYSDQKDQMSGATTRVAWNTSTNSHEFGFPYSGGTEATITLREHPRKGTDVLIRINQGQIICHSYMRCRVSVRFDENPPVKFRGIEPSDGSTTVVFLEPSKKFLQGVKQAKRTAVELEFYQEGSRVFTFETEGLEDW